MPHSSSSNVPKCDVILNRKNSLPTYEEATGSVAPGESGLVAPSAPCAPLPIIRQDEFEFVDSSVPLQHDHGGTNYQYPTAAQSAYREQDVERGIADTSMLRHEDSVVREMTQTVLAECRRAKENREMKTMVNMCGFFVCLVLFLVFIVAKASSHR